MLYVPQGLQALGVDSAAKVMPFKLATPFDYATLQYQVFFFTNDDDQITLNFNLPFL